VEKVVTGLRALSLDPPANYLFWGVSNAKDAL
jgi:hypothetical protein